MREVRADVAQEARVGASCCKAFGCDLLDLGVDAASVLIEQRLDLCVRDLADGAALQRPFAIALEQVLPRGEPFLGFGREARKAPARVDLDRDGAERFGQRMLRARASLHERREFPSQCGGVVGHAFQHERLCAQERSLVRRDVARFDETRERGRSAFAFGARDCGVEQAAKERRVQRMLARQALRARGLDAATAQRFELRVAARAGSSSERAHAKDRSGIVG